MNKKEIYGDFLQCYIKIFGIDAAKSFDSRLRFHRKLDLKNPRTLADKVSYIELHEQSQLASSCTDKYAVRDYVRAKGLEETLVPVVGGAWNRIEEIDFEALPDSFVLKATHGCKMNYLVPDKRRLDREACIREMRRWMETTYGRYSMEPHYTGILHRIYAEKYLGDISGLMDYKIHCLNGRAEFVMVSSDRRPDGDKAMRVTQELYDMDWKPIFEVVGSGQELPGDGKKKKPQCFGQMQEIAKRLSEDFKFVRVDLYEIDGKVYFGELTFSPACGVFAYMSEKFLAEMGEKLVL